MSQLIIGLVGEKGSGKGTFANILEEIAVDARVHSVRYSDVARETLKQWGLNNSRENMSRLIAFMNTTFGDDTLAKAVMQRATDTDADIVLLDGLRWQGDGEVFRTAPNNLLIYITIPPETRYERSKLRGENHGDSHMSFADFMAEEKTQNEAFISALGATADHHIINQGTLDELRGHITQMYHEHIRPQIKK